MTKIFRERITSNVDEGRVKLVLLYQLLLLLSYFSRVQLFATLWIVASVHVIVQARILEWVAISFSRESFQLRDQTHSKGSSRPRDQTLEKPSKSLSGYNQLKRIFLLSFSVIYLSSPFGNLNVQEGQFIGLKNNSWLQIHLWNMDSMCVCVLLIVKILIVV